MVYEEGLYALVDYNLTLCPLQSRLQLQHIYHGQPYARVDFIPSSWTLDLASGRRRDHLVVNISQVQSPTHREEGGRQLTGPAATYATSTSSQSWMSTRYHRLNMEVDLQSLFGLHVT
jgi:hypothetical protein